MALLLQNNDIKDLLSMEQAILVTESLMSAPLHENIRTRAPLHVPVPGGALRIVSGAILNQNVMGVRAGAAAGIAGEGHVAVLFEADSGRILAVMAYPYGTLRTGATVGLATKWLSRPDARSMAMIGTGRNAVSLIQAITQVRPIEEIRVYSRNPEHRAALVKRALEIIAVPLRAVSSPAEAVRGADIVTCSTDSMVPVFDARDLGPKTHVNSMGRIGEVPPEVYQEADGIAVGSREQEFEAVQDVALKENPTSRALFDPERWPKAVNLDEAIRSIKSPPWRQGPTIFKESRGGYGDMAFAYWVYQRCRELGRGLEVDLRGREVV